MPIGARRVFRLASAMALSLGGAYGLSLPLPYIAPILALMLGLKPAPPLPLKGLLGLLILLCLATGAGLLVVPLLDHFPASGFLIVAGGVFLANHLSVNKGKGAVGSLLTVGLTLLTAAGLASLALAQIIVVALVMAVLMAVLSHHLVYLFFPEPSGPGGAAARPTPDEDTPGMWIALRATLIVLPSYFLALTNPSLYIPLIMKSVSLGQQGSITDARAAGRELLGSTFMGGLLAILFWIALDLWTSLWMFTVTMLLFGIFLASRIYRIVPTRFTPPFWINSAVTMLILLGPAVQDAANGNDVYMAFAVRMGLFIFVTVYAWLAVIALDLLRRRYLSSLERRFHPEEPVRC
ncbi:MAG: DUF2955 domain-containing protein [Puniceicoccaceae bacterium]